MGVSVRAQIVKTPAKLRREWKGAITIDGRTLTDGEEIREAWMNELAQGREVVPFGSCDNWDYVTGCRGHVPRDAVTRLLAEPSFVGREPWTCGDMPCGATGAGGEGCDHVPCGRVDR